VWCKFCGSELNENGVCSACRKENLLKGQSDLSVFEAINKPQVIPDSHPADVISSITDPAQGEAQTIPEKKEGFDVKRILTVLAAFAVGVAVGMAIMTLVALNDIKGFEVRLNKVPKFAAQEPDNSGMTASAIVPADAGIGTEGEDEPSVTPVMIEATREEATESEAASDATIPEESTEGETASDVATLEEATKDEAASDAAIPEESTEGEAASDATIPEESTEGEAASDVATLEEATKDEAASDAAIPEEVTEGEAASDVATLEEATKDEATPDAATPEEVTNGEATPDEATHTEPASEEDSSGMMP